MKKNSHVSETNQFSSTQNDEPASKHIETSSPFNISAALKLGLGKNTNVAAKIYNKHMRNAKGQFAKPTMQNGSNHALSTKMGLDQIETYPLDKTGIFSLEKKKQITPTGFSQQISVGVKSQPLLRTDHTHMALFGPSISAESEVSDKHMSVEVAARAIGIEVGQQQNICLGSQGYHAEMKVRGELSAKLGISIDEKSNKTQPQRKHQTINADAFAGVSIEGEMTFTPSFDKRCTEPRAEFLKAQEEAHLILTALNKYPIGSPEYRALTERLDNLTDYPLHTLPKRAYRPLMINDPLKNTPIDFFDSFAPSQAVIDQYALNAPGNITLADIAIPEKNNLPTLENFLPGLLPGEKNTTQQLLFSDLLEQTSPEVRTTLNYYSDLIHQSADATAVNLLETVAGMQGQHQLDPSATDLFILYTLNATKQNATSQARPSTMTLAAALDALHTTCYQQMQKAAEGKENIFVQHIYRPQQAAKKLLMSHQNTALLPTLANDLSQVSSICSSLARLTGHNRLSQDFNHAGMGISTMLTGAAAIKNGNALGGINAIGQGILTLCHTKSSKINGFSSIVGGVASIASGFGFLGGAASILGGVFSLWGDDDDDSDLANQLNAQFDGMHRRFDALETQLDQGFTNVMQGLAFSHYTTIGKLNLIHEDIIAGFQGLAQGMHLQHRETMNAFNEVMRGLKSIHDQQLLLSDQVNETGRKILQSLSESYSSLVKNLQAIDNQNYQRFLQTVQLVEGVSEKIDQQTRQLSQTQLATQFSIQEKWYNRYQKKWTAFPHAPDLYNEGLIGSPHQLNWPLQQQSNYIKFVINDLKDPFAALNLLRSYIQSLPSFSTIQTQHPYPHVPSWQKMIVHSQATIQDEALLLIGYDILAFIHSLLTPEIFSCVFAEYKKCLDEIVNVAKKIYQDNSKSVGLIKNRSTLNASVKNVLLNQRLSIQLDFQAQLIFLSLSLATPKAFYTQGLCERVEQVLLTENALTQILNTAEYTDTNLIEVLENSQIAQKDLQDELLRNKQEQKLKVFNPILEDTLSTVDVCLLRLNPKRNMLSFYQEQLAIMPQADSIAYRYSILLASVNQQYSSSLEVMTKTSQHFSRPTAYYFQQANLELLLKRPDKAFTQLANAAQKQATLINSLLTHLQHLKTINPLRLSHSEKIYLQQGQQKLYDGLMLHITYLAQILLRTGDTLAEMQLFQAAQFFYQKVLIVAPHFAPLQAKRAYVFEHIKDYSAALLCYQEAHALDQNNQLYLEGLARVYEKKSEYQLAITMYEKLQQANVENPEFPLKLAALYSTLKDFKPVRTLLLSVKNNPISNASQLAECSRIAEHSFNLDIMTDCQQRIKLLGNEIAAINCSYHPSMTFDRRLFSQQKNCLEKQKTREYRDSNYYNKK